MAIEPIKGFYVHDEATDTDGVAKYDYEGLANAPAVEPINLIDLGAIVSGYLDGNGNILSSDTYSTTDFISVNKYASLTFSNCNFFGWYDESKVFISPLQGVSSLQVDKTVQKPSSAHYLRISIQNDRLDVAQCGENVTRGDYVPHEKYTLPNLARNDELKVRHFNLFDKEKVDNGYLDGNGNIIYNLSYITSTFIDVSDYLTITLSKTNFIAWYDTNKAFISLDSSNGNTLTVDKTLDVPTNAKFLKLTGVPVEIDNIQVGENVTRASYIPYKYYGLENLKVVDETGSIIVVDVNGGGDYTSITKALYENVNTGVDMVVKSGTYDIVAEYEDLFTQSVVDSLADSTNLNGFQYGAIVKNRKITFETGAHIVCDWTGHTVDATHRFSAFRIDPNAHLVGLDLDCTGTFYCIHDDYGTDDNSAFTVTYDNCRVIGHNIYNANCIGGGCHKYSRHILSNCYFKNNVNSDDLVLSADVRYHNTNTADAEPEVFISNCYFSNNFNATYYGNQTTKMRVYVNNCYAPKGINKRAESSTMNVDNVELYTWNNQTN